jgi:hypothetical protein
VLLVLAGILTQVGCIGCLFAALVSIPVVHDVHGSSTKVIVTAVAALAGIVCAVFVYYARLVPLALALGIDVGFGIVLPRASSPLGALSQILPAGDTATLDGLMTAGAVVMFVAGILCALALPAAIAIRRWKLAGGEDMQPPPELHLVEPGAPGWPGAPDGGDGNELRPSDTLKGFQPARGTAPPRVSSTQVVTLPGSRAAKRHSGMLLIAVGTIVLVGIGIALIAATDGAAGGGSGSTETAAISGTAGEGSGTGSASTGGEGSGTGSASSDAGNSVGLIYLDAGVDAAAVVPDPQEMVDALHKVLGAGDKAGLAAMIDANAFAVGVEANELAEGRDAVVALVQHDLGAKRQDVDAARAWVAHEGDVAWVAEEMRAGGKRFLVTLAASAKDGQWTIAALHIAQAMANDTAHARARDGSLASPDAIPNSHDESPLAQAMRVAFASLPSFVDARSTRADAFNFGSAPGERLVGGAAIKKTFGRLRATVRLHDAVKVGPLGDNGGWGVANVDFTDSDSDGEVTQTFRVLAIWLREPPTADGKWRIVQTQWSNAQ